MCVAILCVDKARSDAFASVTEQDQNVPSQSKHRNSHGMAWVVVFPCGHRNDSVGVLLNHLRNAAPSALPTMDHRRILAPWPLVMCKRCRWTPGMSFHPASWTTPAMSSPFNKQHCRTRRRSSLCHAPWHVRTHSPFHPSLSTKPTLAPHQHIPRHRPRTVIRCAEKFDFVMCARLCAIGCSGRGRGAHWMPERRRRIYSLLPCRARCTRVCCGRRVRACFVTSGKLNVLITTAGAI